VNNSGVSWLLLGTFKACASAVQDTLRRVQR